MVSHNLSISPNKFYSCDSKMATQSKTQNTISYATSTLIVLIKLNLFYSHFNLHGLDKLVTNCSYPASPVEKYF